MSVKVNDTVLVITGGMKSKGKTGTVIATNKKNHTVTVKGVNMVKKHKKARSAQQTSQILEFEAPIDISNVMVVCPACNKPTRIKSGEADGKKVRLCVKCGASLDGAKGTKRAAKKAAEAEAPKAEAPKKRTRKRTAQVVDTPAEEDNKE